MPSNMEWRVLNRRIFHSRKGPDARTTAHPDTEARETEGRLEDKPQDERGEKPGEELEILPSPSRQPLCRSKMKRNKARSADEGK